MIFLLYFLYLLLFDLLFFVDLYELKKKRIYAEFCFLYFVYLTQFDLSLFLKRLLLQPV